MKPIRPVLIYEATVTGTESGAAVSVPVQPGGLTACALVIENSTVTTIDVDVETSPNGSDWFNFDTFAQQTGDAIVLDQITNPRFNLVRVRITGFNGTTADVKVYVQ